MEIEACVCVYVSKLAEGVYRRFLQEGTGK